MTSEIRTACEASWVILIVMLETPYRSRRILLFQLGDVVGCVDPFLAEAAGATEITRYLNGAPHGPSDPDMISQVVRTSLTPDPNDVSGFALRARPGISHGNPRTVSTSVVSGCPEQCGFLESLPSPQSRLICVSLMTCCARTARCAGLKAAHTTMDNTPIIAMRVAPALHGDDRHAKPSLPTPSSQSAHVAQAQGRSKPALSRPRLFVLA
jgi:hypothetical protein